MTDKIEVVSLVGYNYKRYYELEINGEEVVTHWETLHPYAVAMRSTEEEGVWVLMPWYDKDAAERFVKNCEKVPEIEAHAIEIQYIM